MFKLRKILQLTFFMRSKERADQRSEVGVSQPAVHWRQCIDVEADCVRLTRSMGD